MIDIYSIQIPTYIDSKMLNSLMQLASEEKREKAKKFSIPQDTIRCLLGDLLARYAISRKTGYNCSQMEFTVNAYNKPILIEPCDVYFNISHSGNWVVCAVGDAPVGIDIELIKEIDFNIAKRFFTKDEYTGLMKQDPANQLKYFYLLWTLKESYIKADGRGLSLPLGSFSIDIKNDTISVITNNQFNSCFFKKYDIDSCHISSVCSSDRNFRNTIKEVTIADLFQT